jgi:hypothetical protein
MMGDFRLWPLADIPPRVFDVCFQGQTGPVAQAGRLPILTQSGLDALRFCVAKRAASQFRWVRFPALISGAMPASVRP